MIHETLYASPEQAAQVLITHILEAMLQEPDRPFTIALSGGSTPAVLFSVWEKEFMAYTPWTRMYFYWVDERCVPPTDEQSNFGLAQRCLFSKVGLLPAHYYRIRGESDNPQQEARFYTEVVATTVPQEVGIPIFDFVLLGIGDDGHTSSIFPGQYELLKAEEPYRVSVNPYNHSTRICMTGRPMICAKHTCFLVTGAHKRELVEKVLDKKFVNTYPASYVWHQARCARLYASF